MKQLLTIYSLLILGNFNLQAQNGLKADYYDGTYFNRYVATNYVDNIDFYWNNSPPVEGINPHECSIRYTGRIKAPKTGTYTFSARVDDGIRVWVDSIQVISNWQLNDVGFSEGEVELQAGQFYTLKIEYFNALREAELRLLWQLPEEEEEKSWWASWWEEEERTIIPSQYFAPPLEKENEVNIQPEPILVAEEKPQPKRRTAIPQKVIQNPVPKPPKKKVVDTIQQYIPKSVEFNRKEAKILSVSYPELDKLASFLIKHPTRKVNIEGHTDIVGDAHKNFQLSEKRAYAVAAYLVKKGVPAEQLSAKGFGGTKPLVKSDDKKYHPENRRVAFIFE